MRIATPLLLLLTQVACYQYVVPPWEHPNDQVWISVPQQNTGVIEGVDLTSLNYSDSGGRVWIALAVHTDQTAFFEFRTESRVLIDCENKLVAWEGAYVAGPETRGRVITISRPETRAPLPDSSLDWLMHRICEPGFDSFAHTLVQEALLERTERRNGHPGAAVERPDGEAGRRPQSPSLVGAKERFTALHSSLLGQAQLHW